MSIFDKLVETLKKIPPNVKGSPIDRNEFLTELALEPSFNPHTEGDYKEIALELFKLLEDIETAERVTTDYLALRSLVIELCVKRYIYLSEEKVKELRQYQLNEQHHSM